MRSPFLPEIEIIERTISRTAFDAEGILTRSLIGRNVFGDLLKRFRRTYLEELHKTLRQKNRNQFCGHPMMFVLTREKPIKRQELTQELKPN